MNNDMNREIAELCGLKIVQLTVNAKDFPYTERTNAETGETSLMPIPQYDTDPAACMELLEYVSSLEDVRLVDCGRTRAGNHAFCGVHFRDMRESVDAIGDTLLQVVALACRDALRSLKGQTP